MTHTIILTTNEWRQLRRILKNERVDTGDPDAIKAWLLYQAGIDADDHRWQHLAEGLAGPSDFPANLPEGYEGDVGATNPWDADEREYQDWLRKEGTELMRFVSQLTRLGSRPRDPGRTTDPAYQGPRDALQGGLGHD